MKVKQLDLTLEQEKWLESTSPMPTVFIVALCSMPAPATWRVVTALTQEEYLRIEDIRMYVHRYYRSAILVRVFTVKEEAMPVMQKQPGIAA